MKYLYIRSRKWIYWTARHINNSTTGGGAIPTGIGTVGSIGIVTMTDGGSGYSTTPTVTFSSPGVGVGSTALAYAVLNGDSVSEIRITSAGVGYTQIPTITISDPPLIASGEYVFNEIIVGTSSSTT